MRTKETIIKNFVILRVQQYKNENDYLVNKIEKTECELNEYIHINQVNDNSIN